MEKFKTLNNQYCKDIVRHACNGHYRAVYMTLYNCYDYLEEHVVVRLHNFLIEIAPLTLDVFKTLPYEVQSFYNTLWLRK